MLLSANGTLRTILVLLIVWQLLRLFIRMQQRPAPRPPKGTHWASPDHRAPGEVRIERPSGAEGGPSGGSAFGSVQDADFEEIE
ncbi:MAG: hypothetical protein QM724_13065 [Flavobacteriales bacterium]